MPRRKPYTAIGIRRLRCSVKGCQRKGYASWNICSLGNLNYVVCVEHDIQLNRMVVTWVGVSDADKVMSSYIAKVGRGLLNGTE